MNQHPPKSAVASPVSESTNSRGEALDNLSMDSFWLEVENIKQSAEAEQEECSLADVKTQEGRLPKMLGVRRGMCTSETEDLPMHLNDSEACWSMVRILSVNQG